MKSLCSVGNEPAISRILWLTCFALALTLLLSVDAQAYIDPGAGSNYFQKIAGGFLFIYAGAVRLLAKLFRRSKNKNDFGSHRKA